MNLLAKLKALFSPEPAERSGPPWPIPKPAPPPAPAHNIPQSVLDFFPLIEKWAALYPPVSKWDLGGIVWKESDGDPNAVNPSDPSFGLGQVEIPIARAFGNGITADMSDDAVRQMLMQPEFNLQCAAAYLCHLKKRFGGANPQGWYGSYNIGETKFAEGMLDLPYANDVSVKVKVLLEAVK